MSSFGDFPSEAKRPFAESGLCQSGSSHKDSSSCFMWEVIPGTLAGNGGSDIREDEKPVKVDLLSDHS